MKNEPTNHDDLIDVRDVIARFEELETEIDSAYDEYKEAKEEIEEEALFKQPWLNIEHDNNSPLAISHIEFKQLGSLLDEMKGYGGDEQWRGDWYPITLIRRSYFVDYCRELVSDIGDMPKEIPSYIEIDWQATARNLEADYSTVDFDGVEYLYR